ncbi:eukaryotic aspartyl protease family protein [Striga asiatica]|uniref:Eukaryotic aspartyl protease family protein n=1 Tax=Striga asiatica TaxID=4170 RepID=A0A5A7Q6W7_STRAF|nr:eukaryotic aspartyl protease family protein [Striga asiatica]
MATLQCFILSLFKILFYWSILLMLFSSSSNESLASETQFQTFDITSQLSATMCNPSIHPGLKNRKSSAVLELIHRHGSCAATNQTKPKSRPSTADILRNDKLRAESIFNGGHIPVSSGDSFQNSGEYIVTVGLGTPETKLSLLFDTGSDLTWTQCKPHLLGYHNQKGPMFDLRNSTSYSFIPCNSSECSLLAAETEFGPNCSEANQCTYFVTYADGSVTLGYFSKDTLTITLNVVVPGFMFGCSQYTQGIFGLESGILGLGRSNISIVSQTASRFQECFSYCIPSRPSSIGFLAFGKDYDNTTKFTPLIFKPELPNFYVIHIIGIAVEGRKLRISPKAFERSGDAVIDSGTTITSLPSKLYKSLSREFKRVMHTKYKYQIAQPSSDGFLDTCFVPKEENVVPSVSFTFQNNVKLDLDASGIGTLWVFNKSLMCFAFAGTDSTVGLFGNTQQKTFELVYDVAGNKLGIRPGMCN